MKERAAQWALVLAAVLRGAAGAQTAAAPSRHGQVLPAPGQRGGAVGVVPPAGLPPSSQLAPAPTLPKLATSVSVFATAPMPLAAPDRSTRTFSLDDPALLPLVSSPLDLLSTDPSVTLNRRGNGEVQADLSVRGASFEQTLVLVNGYRLNDPETGHFNYDPPLPLEAVQRVDVLHGAGSALFGSDAIGGAVNLVTAPPTHGSASLRAGGGSLGITEQHLSLGGVRGALAARLTAARDTSDGFFYAGANGRGYHSNAAALDAFLTLRPTLAPTEVLLGATDRPFGANLFYGNYDSKERTKSWFASLRQPLASWLTADFAFHRHTDLFILRASNPGVFRNNHVDSAWQADLRALRPFARGELAAGLQATGDAIQSSSLGRHARNQGAGYVSLNLRPPGRWTVSAGARQEIFAGPAPVFSPTVAAGFAVGRGVRLRASLGRGYRLPTYVDLYYSDPATVGNPALRPEHAWSYEGGVEWTHGERLSASATVFTLRQTDAIDYSKTDPAARYQAVNVGQIAFTGVEANAVWQPARGHSVSLGYTGLHAAPPPPGLISRYAYNYASQNGSAVWLARLPGRLDGFALRSVLAVVKRETQTSASAAGTQPPYALVDVSVARTRGWVRPYLRASNLSDTQYQELPGIPLAGRTFVGGVVVSWQR